MPNWCWDKLTVTGAPETLDAFKDKAQGQRGRYVFSDLEKEMGFKQDETVYELNFHSLYPVPDEILAAGYSPTGYRWQTKHWGTKWEAGNVKRIEDEDDRVTWTFETAWCPPTFFIEQVSKDWPDLLFVVSWYEEDVHCGWFAFKNGQEVCAESKAVHWDWIPEDQFEGTDDEYDQYLDDESEKQTQCKRQWYDQQDVLVETARRV